MGLHDSFGHLKHKLWSKERPGVKLPIKLAIWFPTTKSRESTRFPAIQAACDILLESSWRGLQLYFKLHCNWRSARKVMAPKVMGVPIGSLETKCHLDVAPWRATKNIIRGKVVASLKFGLWWILWVWGYLWLVLAPKVFQLCINQLIVWFMQIHVIE
jgi:hypothetical protein